jgi:predicted nucleic acid-binding Zn ribbon protein
VREPGEEDEGVGPDGLDEESSRLAGLPVGEVVDLTPPAQVAREALNRARAAARAKGIRPGQPSRRILADPPPSSGARPGGRDPQTFGAVVQRLLHERGWVQDVSVGGVIGRWREVVGDQVADHCTPETFEDKVLVVRADSTAWATQVRLLTPRLLERLAQEVGDGVVESVTVLGPAGPSFRRGPRSVRGPGPRDTYG